MIELLVIGGVMLLSVAWLFRRPSGYTRPFIPDEPAASDNAAAAVCTPARPCEITGMYRELPQTWTTNARISAQYPAQMAKAEVKPQPARVHNVPVRGRSSFVPNETDIEIDDAQQYPTYGDILLEDEQRVRGYIRRG